MKVATQPEQAKEPGRTAVAEQTAALAEPFDPTLVRFKPAAVTSNRALALAYVDVRTIQDRLDEVLGVEGWQDDYQCLTDGSVVCRLRLRLAEEWVTKVDVGGPSEQPDGGDRLKAAFSDALKRAAVKFGVGRYLYRLPSQWQDYDPRRRQFVRPPTLPAWALPRRKQAEPVRSGLVALPADGVELQQRLQKFEAELVSRRLCVPGELVRHVAEEGKKAGNDGDLKQWHGPAIAFAVEAARKYAAEARRRGGQRKEVA